MNRKALPPLSPECEELRERLEQWRRTREKRTRVPEAIWKSAARLADEFGTNRIARELHLSYATLKKRMNRVSGKKDGRNAEATHAFVEVDMSPSPATAMYAVELVKSSGTRMRIELSRGHSDDLLAMVRAFSSSD